MIILLAITLVAAVTADVSHLFAHSDNLQNDGYHYAKPIGVEVFQAHATSGPSPLKGIPYFIRRQFNNGKQYDVPLVASAAISGADFSAHVSSAPSPSITGAVFRAQAASGSYPSYENTGTHQAAASNQEDEISPVANDESGYQYNAPVVPFESRPPVEKYLPPPTPVSPPPQPPSPPNKYLPPPTTTKKPPPPPSPPKEYLPPANGYSYPSDPQPYFSF